MWNVNISGAQVGPVVQAESIGELVISNGQVVSAPRRSEEEVFAALYKLAQRAGTVEEFTRPAREARGSAD